VKYDRKELQKYNFTLGSEDLQKEIRGILSGFYDTDSLEGIIPVIQKLLLSDKSVETINKVVADYLDRELGSGFIQEPVDIYLPSENLRNMNRLTVNKITGAVSQQWFLDNLLNEKNLTEILTSDSIVVPDEIIAEAQIGAKNTMKYLYAIKFKLINLTEMKKDKPKEEFLDEVWKSFTSSGNPKMTQRYLVVSSDNDLTNDYLNKMVTDSRENALTTEVRGQFQITYY